MDNTKPENSKQPEQQQKKKPSLLECCLLPQNRKVFYFVVGETIFMLLLMGVLLFAIVHRSNRESEKNAKEETSAAYIRQANVIRYDEQPQSYTILFEN